MPSTPAVGSNSHSPRVRSPAPASRPSRPPGLSSSPSPQRFPTQTRKPSSSPASGMKSSQTQRSSPSRHQSTSSRTHSSSPHHSSSQSRSNSQSPAVTRRQTYQHQTPAAAGQPGREKLKSRSLSLPPGNASAIQRVHVHCDRKHYDNGVYSKCQRFLQQYVKWD